MPERGINIMADSTLIWAPTRPTDAGVFYRAPLGTPLPTNATSPLNALFVDHGWLGEDGITLMVNRANTKHHAFGSDLVKTTQDNYEESLKVTLLECDPDVLETVFGAVEMPVVRGFDTALVPLAKPRFLGSHPPRVLVKAVDVVDAAAIADAWNAAARTTVHVGKSPVVVLLVGQQLARSRDLDQALEAAARQRKPAEGPTELALVVVNASDWKCHLPAEVPAAVRKLIDQVCK